MASLRSRLERDFFRTLNSVVEPAVRTGLLSSRLTPTTLIVLESTGFKSGQARRTPLFANRVGGPYFLISTVRGERSFWVKNLKAQPQVQFFIGGQERPAEAVVMANDYSSELTRELPNYLLPLVALLERLAQRGWAFALLAPRQDGN
ncbi:MAG: nitroreductase/quinone reductase family protein [Pseudomonadota bacterium]